MNQDIKQSYQEITDFLARCCGAYKYLDVETCRDLIDSLLAGRVRIVRDSAGCISVVTTWWMIRTADLELVKNGGRPADISGGTIVYVADHAGTGGYPDLIRFIRSTLGRKGVCWHHRHKQPGRFRYYPNKEGVNA